MIHIAVVDSAGSKTTFDIIVKDEDLRLPAAIRDPWSGVARIAISGTPVQFGDDSTDIRLSAVCIHELHAALGAIIEVIDKVD
jgi:hypothetical protein